MPKTSKRGAPIQSELPSTLRRSPAKAQRTFAKTHDSAADSYGEGERANRTAFAAVKHSFERSVTTGNQRSTRDPVTHRPPGLRQAARPGRVRLLAGSMRPRPSSTSISWPADWMCLAAPR